MTGQNNCRPKSYRNGNIIHQDIIYVMGSLLYNYKLIRTIKFQCSISNQTSFRNVFYLKAIVKALEVFFI